jgi:PAS domain S-box-containing protein
MKAKKTPGKAAPRAARRRAAAGRQDPRKPAPRPAPARRSIPERYFALLEGHLARPREGTLAAAAELGRDLVLAGLPLEGIGELHAEALRRLDSDFEDMSPPAFAERTAAPLMGLLMAYGSAFRERLDQAGRAEAALRESEGHYRELFELSPIGLWEQDYSGAKRIIDRLRRKGVRDFRRYFREHPKVLRQMVEAVKDIDVNQALLDIYRAPNLDDFLRTVANPVRMEKWGGFYGKELAALAAGEDRVVLEETEKALDGSDIVTRTVTHIGEAYKDSWARVVSTIEDITQRRRAEEAVRQSEVRYRELFEQSPIGVWEEDYSAVKRIVDRLRKEGVRDFRRYFHEHPEVPRQMVEAVKVIDVNPALLDIYRASDKEAFLRAEDTDPSRLKIWEGVLQEELAALAEGKTRFTLEYADQALDGSRIVIRVITSVGDAYKDSWARVVSTTEDITERRRAEEALRQSEARHRELFEHSPIGIWEEDYSGAKPMIDRLRRKGVRDFRRYFREHPEVLRQMVEAIKDTDINQAILDIYRAPDKETFLQAVANPSRMENWGGFYEKELAALAAGERRVVLEETEKALDGSDIVLRSITHIGEAYKDSWARVVSTTEDITERRRAEEAMRESEERFRSLADNLPGVVFQRRLTSDGRLVYTYVSPGMRELYGVEPEKVIADSSAFLQVLPAEERDRFLAALKHSARTLSPMDLELRVVSADGGTQWQRTISHPFRQESGEVVWDGVAIDITEQKRAEEALRESEERHRELFENSPIGIWEEDYSAAKRMIDRLRRKGVRDFRRYFRKHPKVLRQMVEAIKVIDVNPALVDIYRVSDKETFVQWDEYPARIDSWMSFYEQELAALAEGETRVVLEHADKAYDGSDIVLRSITHIGPAHKDSWARVVSTEEDITERRRAEEAMRESEERFRDLFQQSPIGIWEEDYSGAKPMIDRLRRKGVRDFRRYFREHPKMLRQAINAIKVIDVNQALLDLYRVSDKETYLRAAAEPPRITQWMGFYEQELAALAAGEGRVVMEYPDKAFDGSDIVTRTITHIGPTYKDSWARVVTTGEDITERKRAEDALRRSEVFNRAVLDNVADAIITIGEDDKILSFSGPAERIFGYPAEEAIGKNISLLMPRPKQKNARAWIRAHLPAEGSASTSSEPRRITACRKNGVTFPMELSVRQTVSEGKRLYIAVARDITEREAMQAQLIQAEKLSTLGEMAAGIAHELNQPLNIIRMAADSSLMLMEEGDADLDYQKEQLALIGGQTQRMADIIDHMRIFSRKDDMAAEPFDASASVRNALGLVSEAMHLANIRVAAKVPERCRHVLGHAVQLEQVMVSLLTNAKDAILAHPAPARDRSRGKQRGRITVNLVDDQTSHWIWIIVSDTGGGIPGDVIGHIFEPFYTTKEAGKGTGLGLSVAYGIVTAMGGRIDVWDTTKGARFQIVLPVAGCGPPERVPPPRAPGD